MLPLAVKTSTSLAFVLACSMLLKPVSELCPASLCPVMLARQLFCSLPTNAEPTAFCLALSVVVDLLFPQSLGAAPTRALVAVFSPTRIMFCNLIIRVFFLLTLFIFCLEKLVCPETVFLLSKLMACHFVLESRPSLAPQPAQEAANRRWTNNQALYNRKLCIISAPWTKSKKELSLFLIQSTKSVLPSDQTKQQQTMSIAIGKSFLLLECKVSVHLLNYLYLHMRVLLKSFPSNNLVLNPSID